MADREEREDLTLTLGERSGKVRVRDGTRAVSGEYAQRGRDGGLPLRIREIASESSAAVAPLSM